MSPKGVEHFNTAEVVLDGGMCIHQCRRKALSTHVGQEYRGVDQSVGSISQPRRKDPAVD